jgi:signal transduction histidine kinase
MIVALAPPMVVLSLGTTRLMLSTIRQQSDVALDYATTQNTIAVNRDLTDLRTLISQRTDGMRRAVSAVLADGAVGDLIARGSYVGAGRRLSSALEPSQVSMITVVGWGATTVARATAPATVGDRALWNQHGDGGKYVTNLQPVIRAVLYGRSVSGAVVLGPGALEVELIRAGGTIAGLTRPGDRLSDQAWILLESGRRNEARGLALAVLLPVRDQRGNVQGAALAARIVNRDVSLVDAFGRDSERSMAVCLDNEVVAGDLPTQRSTIIGAELPESFASPVLHGGKQRSAGRLSATGVELNVAASRLRDVRGAVVGMLVAATPLTELQTVVDRMQADAARLQMHSLLTLLVWLCVGAVVALASAALAARGILRPIRELQIGARRIGEGDFAYRLQVHSGDELEQLAQEFNLMAEHLEGTRNQERLAVIGRMASGIVHDIQNALTSIRGYAQLLAEEDVSADERREFAAILVESVLRIADMARDLLEFARGEEAKLEPRVMTLDQYLGDIRPQLVREFAESNITLTLDLDCPKPVRIDPARMSRVIFNLAGNARDAMGNSGAFTIASRCEHGYLEIRCSDTGPGVPPEMEGRLFQPFATYGKPYGTGLGLAICKQIVEAHGGAIEVHSEPGQGATFVIRLPVAQATPQAPAPAPEKR